MTATRGLLLGAWRAGVAVSLLLAGAGFGIAVLAPGPFAADPVSTIARREPAFVALFTKPAPPPPPLDMGSAALYEHFTERGYTLDSVREARVDVPRLYAARLPRDLPELDSIDTRKQVFMKMLLPLVLAENERILAERDRVGRLREQAEAGLPLPPPDAAWLEAVAERYGVARTTRNFWDEMLRRIDTVPPSLALGQAALETGWGTSSVAQTGHAMFGQMEATGDAVRRFNHLAHAIEAYALNLNTHRAYSQFRAKRAEMRLKAQTLDGYDLALTLSRYSERKMDYVRDVRGIIRVNRLRPLDAARLDG
jgi:Bax protein